MAGPASPAIGIRGLAVALSAVAAVIVAVGCGGGDEPTAASSKKPDLAPSVPAAAPAPSNAGQSAARAGRQDGDGTADDSVAAALQQLGIEP